MSVTIRDVAKASNVSVYTVSSVLHNKGDVGPATRDRVLKVIRDLKYDPLKNIPLARKARTETSAFGLVLPVTSATASSFYYRAVLTIQKTAAGLGYGCKLFSEEDITAKAVKNYHAGATQLGCSAVLAFCPNGNWRTYVRNIISWDIPVALVRRESGEKKIITVSDSDYDGAYRILEHLAAAGHTNIATVSLHPGSGESTGRAGAFEVLAEAGRINADPRLRIAVTEYGDAGRRIIELRNGGLNITAVYCDSDDLAAGIISTFSRAGLRVPEDMAVTGYDDDPIASQIFPTLTTVRIPVEAMVEAACKALAAYTPGNGMTGMNLTFENELIIRESCGTKKRRADGDVR